MKVKVLYDSYTDVTSERDPEDQWGHESTYTSWSITGLVGEKSRHYGEEMEVNFDMEEGKTYYLLYAIYSTGDSFNTNDHARAEFIDIYETSEAAEKARKEIEDDPLTDHSFYFTNHAGTKVKQYCPWAGYFENLDDLEVQPLVFRHY